jgi:hypothetical protein
MRRSIVAEWYLSDKRDFQSGFDPNERRGDGDCDFLKSVVPHPKTFGFFSKSVDPAPFLGRRLKMTAQLKTNLPDVLPRKYGYALMAIGTSTPVVSITVRQQMG